MDGVGDDDANVTCLYFYLVASSFRVLHRFYRQNIRPSSRPRAYILSPLPQAMYLFCQQKFTA